MLRNMCMVLCMAVLVAACGGAKKKETSKDAKADYQLTIDALSELNRKTGPEAEAYDGKVAELKGILKGNEESGHSAAPNKYVFYLYDVAAPDDDVKRVICYTDTDQSANEGKTVTVKGKLDYAGIFTIINTVVY